MRATTTTRSGPVQRCQQRPCSRLVRTRRSHTRWTDFSGPVTDNNIGINKSIDGVRGSTAPDQSITLYRGAFENEEQLSKTLVHEQYHVNDLRNGMPYPETYDAGATWEQAAEDCANAWWGGLGG